VVPRLLDCLFAGAGLGDDLDVAGALEQSREQGGYRVSAILPYPEPL
jgi:hypothetical protein